MNEPPITRVSDHAVLRYMERVLGCDVEGVRRVIEEECATALALGASSTAKDGVTYRLHNGRVLTVHTGRRRVTKTDQRRAQERIEAGA